MLSNTIHKILVAENQVEIREFLRGALRASDYECTVAAVSKDAFSLIGNGRFDLVIAAVGVSNEFDTDLLSLIDARHEETDFLIIAEQTHQGSYTNFLKAGAIDFIRKPFDYNTLQGRLHRILRERENRCKLQYAIDSLNRLIVIHSSVSTIGHALISSKSLEEISNLILECAKETTESPIGYVGYLDKDTQEFICPAWCSCSSMPCEIKAGSDMHMQLEGHEWGLRERKPFMTNIPAEATAAEGALASIAPIQRFLSMPSMVGDKLLGQIVLANSGRDYSEEDMEWLADLAAFYAIAVERVWNELELSNANRRLQSLLDERTKKFNAAGELLRRSIAAVKQGLSDDQE